MSELKMGQNVVACVPDHDGRQQRKVCVVVRRYTVDGTYHLRGQDGQEYAGIPGTDIMGEYVPGRDDAFLEVERRYQAGELTEYQRDSQVRYLVNSLVRAEDRFEIREAGSEVSCQGGDGPCPNGHCKQCAEFECGCPRHYVWDKQRARAHYDTPGYGIGGAHLMMYLDEADAEVVRDDMIDAAQKGEL